MAIAENPYPKKVGHPCLKILDPKYGFQVTFQTQKHGTHTPSLESKHFCVSTTKVGHRLLLYWRLKNVLIHSRK